MAPTTKGYRAPPVVRAHSRTGSASKLPINLQFTQKKVLPRPKQPPHNGQKQRPGFHIASPGDEEEEEDWVSSESGAVTPNPHNDDDSDLESNESNDNRPAMRRTPEKTSRPTDLPRVATARPSDYRTEVDASRTQAEPSRRTQTTTRMQTRIDTTTPTGNGYRDPPLTPSTAPPSQAASPSHRRHSSRPMSSHSMYKPELRPHPLIRGQSFGQPSLAPKPSPLLPVAVTLDADVAPHLSSSPSTSPTSPHPSLARRTSISSARSVATVATSHPQSRSVREARHRTFSTLSTASSSAALSSLTHLPAVSRPPTPQMIAFFPPANPHVRVDDIHPLLPPPYVTNHLTVLARRTPIRDAFDRVVRARQTARS